MYWACLSAFSSILCDSNIFHVLICDQTEISDGGNMSGKKVKGIVLNYYS